MGDIKGNDHSNAVAMDVETVVNGAEDINKKPESPHKSVSIIMFDSLSFCFVLSLS